MGFFTPDTAPALAPRSRVNSGRSKKAEIAAGATGCDACPLKAEWPRLTSPRMTPTAVRALAQQDILVLGDAPNEVADTQGKAFVGPSGMLLRDNLPRRMVDRMAFQNTVRCHPADNRVPTAQEGHACSVHLQADIDAMPKLKAILGVGSVPLARFVPRQQIGNVHGLKIPVRVGSRVVWYYPLFDPSYVMRMKTDWGDGPAKPVFKGDLQRFINEVDRWPQPKIADLKLGDYIQPQSLEDARALLTRMRRLVAIDIENATDTGQILHPYVKKARIVTAAISDGEMTMAFPVDHPEAKPDWALDFLLEVFQTRHWIAHNASHELAWFLWFANAQRKPLKTMFEDTMALARVNHSRETINGLDDCSTIHLGVNIKTLGNYNTAHILQYPLKETLAYNALDAKAEALLYDKLVRETKRDQYEHLLRTIESTVRMELAGLPVAADVMMPEAIAPDTKIVDYWERIKETRQKDASKIYEVREYERATAKEFNIGSPEQVGEVLVGYGKIKLPKTPAGKQHITDDGTLSRVAPNHPLVKLVLEYREATKMKSTYADPIIAVPNVYTDGLLHPTYGTCNVSTLRLSSSDPNIQNFPKRGVLVFMRKFLVAPDGYVIAACDYGQLQVRIIAMVSGDTKLAEFLITGHDMHSEWLDRCISAFPPFLEKLAHKAGLSDEKKVRKAGRDMIKSFFVFALLFGANEKSISESTGIPVGIVKELIEDFWSVLSGVRRWIKARRNEYGNTGGIIFPTGIERHAILKGNEPINNPIQDVERWIVQHAQNELSAIAVENDDFHWHPRINVHDDLTFLLPDTSKAADYIEGIQEEMLRVRFPWQTIPLTVEVKTGYDWSNLTEVATYTGAYNRRGDSGRGSRAIH